MLIKITDGAPVDYSIRQLRCDNPQVSFPAEIGAKQLAEFGVYEADIADAAPTQFHEAGKQSAVIIDGKAVITREWTAPDLASIKARAVSELSRRRDARIESGFDFGGVTAPCDDKSIGRYTAAYVLASGNPDMKLNWKLPNGFVELDATQIKAMAAAAVAFVQECFNTQKGQMDLIDAAETVEEVEAILADAG